MARVRPTTALMRVERLINGAAFVAPASGVSRERVSTAPALGALTRWERAAAAMSKRGVEEMVEFAWHVQTTKCVYRVAVFSHAAMYRIVDLAAVSPTRVA